MEPKYFKFMYNPYPNPNPNITITLTLYISGSVWTHCVYFDPFDVSIWINFDLFRPIQTYLDAFHQNTDIPFDWQLHVVYNPSPVYHRCIHKIKFYPTSSETNLVPQYIPNHLNLDSQLNYTYWITSHVYFHMPIQLVMGHSICLQVPPLKGYPSQNQSIYLLRRFSHAYSSSKPWLDSTHFGTFSLHFQIQA